MIELLRKNMYSIFTEIAGGSALRCIGNLSAWAKLGTEEIHADYFARLGLCSVFGLENFISLIIDKVQEVIARQINRTLDVSGQQTLPSTILHLVVFLKRKKQQGTGLGQKESTIRNTKRWKTLRTTVFIRKWILAIRGGEGRKIISRGVLRVCRVGTALRGGGGGICLSVTKVHLTVDAGVSRKTKRDPHPQNLFFNFFPNPFPNLLFRGSGEKRLRGKADGSTRLAYTGFLSVCESV